MITYEFDPATEEVDMLDCPGIEKSANDKRCYGVGDVTLENGMKEFACHIDFDCPLIGGAALRSAIEGDRE